MHATEQTDTFAQGFHQAGFGVVRGALTPRLVEELRMVLRQLIQNDQADDPPRPLQRIVPRIVECDERFADLAASPPMIATLREIFGVVPQLVCSYGHEKPGGTAAHTRPHSDVAHLPGVPHHDSLLMVKAMYALTAVTTGSGGTLIYPRTHRRPAGSDAEAEHGHCPTLASGDLLIFHANVRHTATDNVSPNARLSLWFIYALPWMRVFPGYEYGEDFLRSVRRRAETQPYLNSIFGLDDPYATHPA